MFHRHGHHHHHHHCHGGVVAFFGTTKMSGECVCRLWLIDMSAVLNFSNKRKMNTSSLPICNLTTISCHCTSLVQSFKSLIAFMQHQYKSQTLQMRWDETMSSWKINAYYLHWTTFKYLYSTIQKVKRKKINKFNIYARKDTPEIAVVVIVVSVCLLVGFCVNVFSVCCVDVLFPLSLSLSSNARDFEQQLF